MKTAAHNLLLIVALLFSAAPLRAEAPDLRAAAANKQFWIARVDARPQGPLSRIMTRAEGESSWKLVADIPDAVVSVAPLDGQIAIALENGRWLTVWQGGSNAGRALPGDAAIVALADSRGGLLGVGTAPAPATTQSTTAPAMMPVLYRLERDGWQPIREISASAGITPADIAILASGDDVLIAIRIGPRRVQVTGKDSAEPTEFESRFDIHRFKLIDTPRGPVLWAGAATGEGGLWRLGSDEFVPLEAPQQSKVVAVTAAWMAERLRVLLLAEGQIYEQLYNEDGSAQAINPIGLEETPVRTAHNYWYDLLIMGLLLLALLGTAGRRRPLEETLKIAAQSGLAPLRVRIYAGLIDFVPLMLIIGAVAVVVTPVDNPMVAVSDPRYIVWQVLLDLLYIGHVTIGELIYGRSIGKWLMGLRVASLDGSPASTRSILVRNLLRVVDLVLLFTLVTIFYSPLRQRLGDMAAGTIVISDQKQQAASSDTSPPRA